MKIASFFKHLFIPHTGNDFKPVFFREHIVLTILIGSILMLLLSATSYTILRTTQFGSSVASSVLIDLTNQTRKRYNLPLLASNPKLKKAAILKGEDMNNHKYFSHYSPSGIAPWHWFDEAGYMYSFAGENLAINFTNSEEVERAWLASKKHRDNILSPNYEDIGIATIRGESDGIPVLFVIQMFGKQISPENKIAYRARWYELLLFNGPSYVGTLYMILVILLLIALILMIVIEIKKQHVRHILYGVALILVVSVCLVINSYLV